jgi:hypothetical protein
VVYVRLAQDSHQWRDTRNEPSAAIKHEEFLGQLRDYKLVKTDVYVIISII